MVVLEGFEKAFPAASNAERSAADGDTIPGREKEDDGNGGGV
jgi:hypothetical protein